MLRRYNRIVFFFLFFFLLAGVLSADVLKDNKEQTASFPIVGEVVYFTLGSEKIYAVNSQTGKKVWEFQASDKIIPSVFIKSGQLHFTTQKGRLYILELATGKKVKEQFTDKRTETLPLVTEESIYVISKDRKVYAFAKDGKKLWEFNVPGIISATPTFYRDKVFFGSYGGKFYALDKTTGKQVWVFDEGSLNSAIGWWRLPLVCFITALVNVLTVVTGAARLAGVRTKRIATSITFNNISLLLTRLATLVQGPVMGNIVDLVVLSGNLDTLVTDIRWILLSATVGSVIGTILIPTFVIYYTKGISEFENKGSLPKVMLGLLSFRKIWKVISAFRMPRISSIRDLQWQTLPKAFLIFNMFMTAIWTVGVLAAIYASALVPEFARTATLLSGIVNGFATIMFALLVDPTAAILTDQAVTGKRNEKEIKAVIFFIAVGSIIGTLLSQLILVQAAQWIAFVTKILGSIK